MGGCILVLIVLELVNEELVKDLVMYIIVFNL